jgi:D-alanyl-D-alanine carboxypeptidase
MRFLYKILSWFAKPRLSVDEELADQPLIFSSAMPPSLRPRLLTTAEIVRHYGKPGDPDNLVTITAPFPFRIAWTPKVTTDRISCHKKIAERLQAVFTDLLAHYGVDKIKELGIDLFGGMNNFRPQRGLEKKYDRAIAAGNYALAITYLSRHSWATAIDLDPARNTLKETSRTARFARPEYKPMIDIFYKHGFIGYGIERNNDWMHFEIGMAA